MRSCARRSNGAGGSFLAGENVAWLVDGGLAATDFGGVLGVAFCCDRFAVKLAGEMVEIGSWPSGWDTFTAVFRGGRDRFDSSALPLFGERDETFARRIFALGFLSAVVVLGAGRSARASPSMVDVGCAGRDSARIGLGSKGPWECGSGESVPCIGSSMFE